MTWPWSNGNESNSHYSNHQFTTNQLTKQQYITINVFFLPVFITSRPHPTCRKRRFRCRKRRPFRRRRSSHWRRQPGMAARQPRFAALVTQNALCMVVGNAWQWLMILRMMNCRSWQYFNTFYPLANSINLSKWYTSVLSWLINQWIT